MERFYALEIEIRREIGGWYQNKKMFHVMFVEQHSQLILQLHSKRRVSHPFREQQTTAVCLLMMESVPRRGFSHQPRCGLLRQIVEMFDPIEMLECSQVVANHFPLTVPQQYSYSGTN